jgi:anti-anti-sigma factor
MGVSGSRTDRRLGAAEGTVPKETTPTMTVLRQPAAAGRFRFQQSRVGPSARDRASLRVEPSRCSIVSEDDGLAGVLTVSGELDAVSVRALVEELNRMHWSDTEGRFVIDLRGVTRVDDRAVASLATAWRAISAKGGHLALICQNGPLATSLAGTELHAAMHVQPAAPALSGDAGSVFRSEPAPSVSVLRRLTRVLAPAGGPAR